MSDNTLEIHRRVNGHDVEILDGNPEVHAVAHTTTPWSVAWEMVEQALMDAEDAA